MESRPATNEAAAPKLGGTSGVSRLSDPLWFAHLVLGAELWKTQRDILAAVARHRRVAVKACHASGKSYAIAVAALWWLVAHRDGIVVTTAPTWLQVEKVIWGELKKLLLCAEAHGIVRFPRPQRTELKLAAQNYVLGLSTDDSSRFQGFHSGHVLIILDEAPGVRAEVYEAVEGIRAGGQVHVLAIGNPTVASGPLHEAFTTNRTVWKTFTINSFDTPNLRGLPLEAMRQLPPGLAEDDPVFAYQPRPYLVTRRWVYEKLWEWGEDSPLWQARVLGSFPEQAQDSLLSLRWLELAWRPKAEPNDEDELYVGIDVAEAGVDETVCVVRTRAGRIVAIRSWRGNSRGPVINFLTPFKARLAEINYDRAGVGASFADDFESFGFIGVNGVNVGEASTFPDRFRNLKAQLYWALRERFENGEVSALQDELTVSQLASIRYEINSRGQVEIESKEARRQRGATSPDRAEALMLAFADCTPGIIKYYKDPAERPDDEESDGQELIDLYNRVSEEIEAFQFGHAVEAGGPERLLADEREPALD